MNYNLLIGSKFARKFNKTDGVITYSGTLAIEIALCCLNLPNNSKVLVSSNVCYSIVNTILKLNLVPVLKIPKNNLFFTDEDVLEVLNSQNISCILLVHQFGLLNEIDKIKYRNKGIKIIEDIAQAWSIDNRNQNYIIGENSDIVVTSFGITKPISYGIGGGLFFNKKQFLEKIDFYDNFSREKNPILLSYTYPLCSKMNYNKLKNIADSVVEEQRNNAKEYSNILKKQEKIKFLDSNIYIGNVWHRFPIWVEDQTLYNKIVQLLKYSNLEYQLEHEIKLEDLPICINCIKIENKCNKFYPILLRTRNLNIIKQLDELNHLIKSIN